MLVIRTEQMWILRQAQLQKFEDDMVAHLTERFAGRSVVADGDGLRSLIRQGKELAGAYGVVDEYDVRRFLEFRAEYGADFHQIPWIASILNDPTLSGCGKMERIDGNSLFTVRS